MLTVPHKGREGRTKEGMIERGEGRTDLEPDRGRAWERQAELERETEQAVRQRHREAVCMLKRVADSCQCSDLVAQDWGILPIDPDTFLRSSVVNPCRAAVLYCSAAHAFVTDPWRNILKYTHATDHTRSKKHASHVVLHALLFADPVRSSCRLCGS